MPDPQRQSCEHAQGTALPRMQAVWRFPVHHSVRIAAHRTASLREGRDTGKGHPAPPLQKWEPSDGCHCDSCSGSHPPGGSGSPGEGSPTSSHDFLPGQDEAKHQRQAEMLLLPAPVTSSPQAASQATLTAVNVHTAAHTGGSGGSCSKSFPRPLQDQDLSCPVTGTPTLHPFTPP